jgi:glutamine synthetase
MRSEDIMQPEQVRTAADARAIVEERGLSHVKVGVFDNDGVLRGKYMSRETFFGALDKGFGFCDVVLGWDSNDQLYDNVKYTGWHTAYPDALVRVLPASCRALPLEGNMLFFLGEFAEAAESVCPRAVLRRVLARAEKLGFGVSAAAEFEFFMFRETPESVRDKGYRGLQTLTPGYFGYSVLRSSVHSEFYHALLKLSEDMRFPIEGLHTETGPGVLEAAIQYCEALEAADRAALFKTFTKVLAQRNGMMATFMAKWSKDWPGQRPPARLAAEPQGWRGGVPRRRAAARHLARDALVPWRAAGADARGAGDGGLDRQQLFTPGAGLLGADVGDLGHREPHDGAASDPGWAEVAARRIPHRRRRH